MVTTVPPPSVAAAVVQAVEHAVVEAVIAVAGQVQKNEAADLKSMVGSVSKEVVATRAEDVPTLAEEVEEGVIKVAKDVIKGAEEATKAVEAHPELLAEGAVVVAASALGMVAPAIAVGGIAMIGKLAADSAIKTVDDIAVNTSTSVVKEIAKDLATHAAQGTAKVATQYAPNQAGSVNSQVTIKVKAVKGVKSTEQSTIVATATAEPNASSSTDRILGEITNATDKNANTTDAIKSGVASHAVPTGPTPTPIQAPSASVETSAASNADLGKPQLQDRTEHGTHENLDLLHHESLTKLHQKLDSIHAALNERESLDQLHQKMDAMQNVLQQLAQALAGAATASISAQPESAPRKNPVRLPTSLITPTLPPSTFQTPPVSSSDDITGIPDSPNTNSNVNPPAQNVVLNRSSMFSGFVKLFWPGNVPSRVSTSASD